MKRTFAIALAALVVTGLFGGLVYGGGGGYGRGLWVGEFGPPQRWSRPRERGWGGARRVRCGEYFPGPGGGGLGPAPPPRPQPRGKCGDSQGGVGPRRELPAV